MISREVYRNDSAAIEWLRFPLIVCVVFIHSFGEPVDMTLIDWTSLSGNDIYDIIRVLFSRVITHSAVPCFYFISGYLFFLNIQKLDKSSWLTKMRKRVRTLLVPYILWNVIFIAATCGKLILKWLLGMSGAEDITSWFNDNGGLPGLFWNCSVWGESAVDWLGNPQRSSGPIDLPLWFLRDLIVVTVLTPIIYWLIKRCGLLFITVLGLAFVSKVWPLVDGFSIPAIFFFSCGAYMGINKISISVFAKYETLIYIITVLLIAADLYLGGPDTGIGNLVHPFFRISGVLASFCIALRLRNKGHVRYPMLTKSVFFIYAFHCLHIIGYYFGGMWMDFFNNSNELVKTLVYFLVPALKISACFIVFVLMERFTPRLLAILTGSRN